MLAENSKNDVLKIRMDSLTMQLLEKARSYVDLDRSKFIRQSIQEKANTLITEHDHTRFNATDWRMFFEMLDNPPVPTERMKKAALFHEQLSS